MSFEENNLVAARAARSSAERILDALTCERDEINRKIKQAIQHGTNGLAELRHQLFAIESLELPLAEIVLHEAAAAYFEAEAEAAHRQAAAAHANLDQVCLRR